MTLRYAAHSLKTLRYAAHSLMTFRYALHLAIMIADILTKAVARPLFIDLLRRMREYARHADQRMLVSSSPAVVSSGGAATT